MRDKKVNYIQHLNKVTELFQLDERTSIAHIGFYLILFDKWNRKGFRNPIKLCRSDLMDVMNIKSRNTYSKLLRELMEYGYIIYFPSKSSIVPSKVHMFKFCATRVQHVGPLYKHINILNLNSKIAISIQAKLKSQIHYTSENITCSIIEQHVSKVYNEALSNIPIQSTDARAYKSKPNLHPTGHQPTPDADYSEPL